VSTWRLIILTFGGGAFVAPSASAQTNAPANDAAELAKKLSNPVADLISVLFQNNFEFGGGPNDDGFRYLLNFQPVIPVSLNTNWNLISRSIVPFIHQEDMISSGSQTGLGDITQSLFLSPKKPTSREWIWGVGPVFLIPSATDDLLGSEKFGIGPTAVLLKQEHGWTYGALINHIWSVAGEGVICNQDWRRWGTGPVMSFDTQDDSPDDFVIGPALRWRVAVNKKLNLGMFSQNVFWEDTAVSQLQPVIAYQLGHGWSLSAGDLQFAYDGRWKNGRARHSASNLAKVTKLGKLRVRLSVNPQYSLIDCTGLDKWSTFTPPCFHPSESSYEN
jgi:hypothetical protein